MYDETVTVGEIRRRHLEVAAHVLEKVAASGAEWADLDAVDRAAAALRQLLDQERSEEAGSPPHKVYERVRDVLGTGYLSRPVQRALEVAYRAGREDAAVIAAQSAGQDT